MLDPRSERTAWHLPDPPPRDTSSFTPALLLRRGKGVPHSLKWIFWSHTFMSIIHTVFFKAVLLWNFVCCMHMHVTLLPSLSLSVWDCSCMSPDFLTFISCFLHCLCWICAVLIWSHLSACSTAASFPTKSVTLAFLWVRCLYSSWRLLYPQHAWELISQLHYEGLICSITMKFKEYKVYAFSMSIEIIRVSLHTRKIG